MPMTVGVDKVCFKRQEIPSLVEMRLSSASELRWVHSGFPSYERLNQRMNTYSTSLLNTQLTAVSGIFVKYLTLHWQVERLEMKQFKTKL